MLDSWLRPKVDPVVEKVAQTLLPLGVSANTVTIVGFGFGLAAIAAIAVQHYWIALLLFGLNRLADGLDGAIARHREPTDLGGFLDIVLDFIIYSGMVFGFALADPDQNALAAAFLIFSFMGTGGSFLAFAIMAAKRRIETEARGKKSIFYLGGLAEGSETIAVLAAFCVFPGAFVEIAIIFGIMCWLTTIGRIRTAYETLG